MGVNSLPKTVTRQRRDCDLNPGPSAPESSTLTTRLPSHPDYILNNSINTKRELYRTLLLPNFHVHRRVKMIPVVACISSTGRPAPLRTRYMNRLNSQPRKQ